MYSDKIKWFLQRVICVASLTKAKTITSYNVPAEYLLRLRYCQLHRSETKFSVSHNIPMDKFRLKELYPGVRFKLNEVIFFQAGT